MMIQCITVMYGQDNSRKVEQNTMKLT